MMYVKHYFNREDDSEPYVSMNGVSPIAVFLWYGGTAKHWTIHLPLAFGLV